MKYEEACKDQPDFQEITKLKLCSCVYQQFVASLKKEPLSIIFDLVVVVRKANDEAFPCFHGLRNTTSMSDLFDIIMFETTAHLFTKWASLLILVTCLVKSKNSLYVYRLYRF